MTERVFAVKGMNDILPPQSARWEWFEQHVREVMSGYAYLNLRTPVLEHTALFVKGTGQTTDIVEKEMYSFEDRLNGEQLTLRPENTPGVVRAAIEHNLTYDGGKRLYYLGPMFRHERPQRGRYRQFYQLGCEAIGFSGPELDAELMLLVDDLFGRLGIGAVRVELNSLGLAAERMSHRAALITYFEARLDQLDAEARRRLYSNPLRVLDSKNPAMQDLVQEAPTLLSFLGESSLKHFDAVKSILSAAGIRWVVNPRMVRGLDYYSHTVFEFITDELGAQGTLCGGGRYDGLFELLGGKPTPGVGWGMGIERVLELVQERGVQVPQAAPDVFAVVPDVAMFPQVMKALSELRSCGLKVQMHAAAAGALGSMKAQFRRADASGARYAIVFGAEELARGEVTVKSLRDGKGEQALRPLAELAAWAPTLQSKS